MTATKIDLPGQLPASTPEPRTPNTRERLVSVIQLRLSVPVLAAILGTLVLAPLVALQWRAMADGGSGYNSLLSAQGLGEVIRVTVALALGSVAIAVVLGVALAWAGYSLRGRWRVLATLPMLPVVIPPMAAVTGWAFLLSPGVGYMNALLRKLPWWSDLARGPVDVFTVPWIVIITGFTLVAFVYVFVLTGLRSIDPSLLVAARVSGAGPWRVFFTVVLPLLRPHIFYGGAIVLLLGLGQFTAPLLLGRQAQIGVLTTEMFRSAQTVPVDYGLAAAYGSPLIIVGVVLIVLQSRLIGGLHRYSSNQGTRASQLPSSTALPVLAILAFFFFAVVLPLSALLIVACSPFWAGTIDWAAFSLDNFRAVWDRDLARRAIFTSINLSILSVAICTPLTYAIATTLSTRSSTSAWARKLIDVLTNVPLAMPGVIFGAGVLFAATSGSYGLYGSPALLVFAYVIIIIPHMVRIMLGQMISVGGSYAEASRVSGGGPIRTHVFVLLPLMRKAIAAGAALGIALLSHEFAASLMVRTPRTQVMGTILYDFWTGGLYPGVAVMALIMCVVATLGVIIAWALGGRSVVEQA